MWRKRVRRTLAVAGCALVSASSQGLANPPASVRLDSGRVSKFKWSVVAFQNGSRSRPCIRINFDRLRHRNPVEIELGETSCRPVQPLPNLLGVVDELDKPQVTVIALAFPPAAYSVSLFFSGNLKDRKMDLKLLSQYKAAKAKLRPFRYGAIAFKGNSCLSRFVTHSKDGTILDDGGRMRCQD